MYTLVSSRRHSKHLFPAATRVASMSPSSPPAAGPSPLSPSASPGLPRVRLCPGYRKVRGLVLHVSNPGVSSSPRTMSEARGPPDPSDSQTGFPIARRRLWTIRCLPPARRSPLRCWRSPRSVLPSLTRCGVPAMNAHMLLVASPKGHRS